MSLDQALSVTEYKCKGCGYSTDSEENAQQCCADVEETDGYECQHCGAEHDTDEEARDCCLEDSRITIVCPGCMEEWTVEDDKELEEAVKAARRCCNGGDEVTRYRCNECDESHGTKSEASACHPNVEEVDLWECPHCEFRSPDKGIAMLHCTELGKNH